jgi:hypothetical protein
MMVDVSDEDKVKFEKCQEYRQLGYLCDIYPTCDGCKYQIPDDVYAALGGKLVR